MSDKTHSSRRDLLRFASLAPVSGGLASAASGETMYGVPFEARPKVRMGFIGVGSRGSFLLRNFAAVEGVEVTVTQKGRLLLTWTQEPGLGGNGRGCQVAEVWLIRK